MSLFRREYYGDQVLIKTPVFAAASIPTIFFIADTTYKVLQVQEVHTTASSSGTLQVEQLTGTTAPGSGTNLLSATVSTAGTANTVVTGAVKGIATIAAGDRLALVSGGTQTGLVNAIVTVLLQKV